VRSSKNNYQTSHITPPVRQMSAAGVSRGVGFVCICNSRDGKFPCTIMGTSA
jgi:hypothetical protein